MKEINSKEIQMYLHCPARWLYQYVYKADYPMDLAEVYSNALEETIKFFFRRVLKKFITFDDLAIQWSNIWRSITQKIDIDEKDIEDYERKGLLTLVEIYDKISPEITVLATCLPWKSEWEDLDLVVRGDCLAVVAGTFVGDYTNEHSIYVVETIPAYTPIRGDKAARQIYHLGRSAVSSEAREAYRKKGIGLILIDLRHGSISVEKPVNYQSLTPIIKNVLIQMAHKCVVPNWGSHCSSCPYNSVCSSSLLTSSSLRTPNKTRKEMEANVFE